MQDWLCRLLRGELKCFTNSCPTRVAVSECPSIFMNSFFAMQASEDVEIVLPCPTELLDQLEGLASLRGVSISELVIESLQKKLSPDSGNSLDNCSIG